MFPKRINDQFVTLVDLPCIWGISDGDDDFGLDGGTAIIDSHVEK